ncbi:MAG: CsbD family protein [Gemmatimonadaceae bacterium]|nr:CsbD family protein [Acetobacteraceae bacterium]
MDEDRIEGAATNLGGKVKDAFGNLVGDSKTQAEGKADQASGQVQNAFGSAKDVVREQAGSFGAQVDGMMRDRPLNALLIAGGIGYLLSFLIHRR